MDIKVLGPGCANCRTTVALLEQVVKERGIPASVAKIEDLREISAFGILSTPGVVIDGVVVHAGGIPARAKVEQWFSAFASAGPAARPPCCGGAAKAGCCG